MLKRWIQTNTGLVTPIEALQNAKSLYLTASNINYISQLRFLLGLLYAAKVTEADLKKGELRLEKISELVKKHEISFDTLYGWYSQPSLEGTPVSYSKLLAQAASGNNKTTYAYKGQFTRDDQFLALSEADLCNAILENQNFSLDFGRSSLGSRHHSPLATSAIGIGVGENLFETLQYNYLNDPYNSKVRWLEQRPSNDDIINQTENQTGYAGRMTWVAQALRFESGGVINARGLKLSGIGDPFISAVEISAGPRKGEITNIGIDDVPYVTACQMNSPALEHAKNLGATTMLLVAQRNDPNQPAKLLERFEAEFPLHQLDPRLGAVLKSIRGKINYLSSNETTSRAIITTITEHRDFALETLPGIIEETLSSMGQRRFANSIQNSINETLAKYD
jgi:hypothetical protein